MAFKSTTGPVILFDEDGNRYNVEQITCPAQNDWTPMWDASGRPRRSTTRIKATIEASFTSNAVGIVDPDLDALLQNADWHEERDNQELAEAIRRVVARAAKVPCKALTNANKSEQ